MYMTLRPRMPYLNGDHMTKDEAKGLTKGQTIYYLGLNYIVHDCKVEDVTISEADEVVVTFDDGCVDTFGVNTPKYLFLTRKEAIEAAEYELEGMLEMLRQNLTN